MNTRTVQLGEQTEHPILSWRGIFSAELRNKVAGCVNSQGVMLRNQTNARIRRILYALRPLSSDSVYNAALPPSRVKQKKMRKYPPGTCRANASNVKFCNIILHCQCFKSEREFCHAELVAKWKSEWLLDQFSPPSLPLSPDFHFATISAWQNFLPA